MSKYFLVPNEEDMWWSSWIGRLVVQSKGVMRSITSAHPPCASVSFSPLCPPCSGSQEGGTRSRRWCAEAVGKHTEIRRINCHSGAKHTHTHTHFRLENNSALLNFRVFPDDMSVTGFRNPVVLKLKPLYEDVDHFLFVLTSGSIYVYYIFVFASFSWLFWFKLFWTHLTALISHFRRQFFSKKNTWLAVIIQALWTY